MKPLSASIADNSRIRGVKKKLVQGRAPLHLIKKTSQILKLKRISWTDFITGSLILFIRENDPVDKN